MGPAPCNRRRGRLCRPPRPSCQSSRSPSPRNPDRLAAGERLGVEDAGEVAPVPGPVADRVDHARAALGLVVHQLRAIAPQRRDLGVELVGDVDRQARPLDDPQVDAEVIEDPRRVERLAGDVGLASACSRTARPRPAWSRRYGRDGRPPSRGRTAAGAAPGGTRPPGRGGGSRSARGCGWAVPGSSARDSPGPHWPPRSRPRAARDSPAASARRWSGPGCPPPALPDQPDDRAAHAELGIIRMRGDHQRVEHGEEFRNDILRRQER